MEKIGINLKEPEQALAWLAGFKARCRADGKIDVVETVEHPAKLNMTDQFLFRCGTDALVKLGSLVAPKKLEDMPFKDIEQALKSYLEPQQRLVMAEQTTFVTLVQATQESKADYLARLRESARHCDFDKLKDIADMSVTDYMVRLRFVAGLGDVDGKIKAIEELSQKEQATAAELLSFLQRREQALIR